MSDLNTPDLLDSSDFQKFKQADPDWFLGAIGSLIRNHCGWHIYPVKTDTANCLLGPQGTIPLPSLKVVDVQSLTYEHRLPGMDPETVTVDPNEYTVHEAGFIEWRPSQPISRGTNGIHYVRPKLDRVTVTFTHGFEEIPGAVAMVGYEIAMRAMEKPAGIAKSIAAGPYNFAFNEFGGYISESQNVRLAPFALQGVVM